MKRPSFATVVALLALFVALGGPAEAARLIDGKLLRKGSVKSKAIKDGTVKLRDLNRRTVRTLRVPADGSVDATKLRNGAVTAGKLTVGAVGSAAIADRSVGAGDIAAGAIRGEHVADGWLAVNDYARFYGQFSVEVGELDPDKCWSGEPVGLAPERAGADIGRDLILVSAGQSLLERRLTVSVRAASTRGRFVVAVCNVGAPEGSGTPQPVDAGVISLRYLVIDLP